MEAWGSQSAPQPFSAGEAPKSLGGDLPNRASKCLVQPEKVGGKAQEAGDISAK